jgi:hypothetical protein
LDWLLGQQPGYWARQLHERQEELAQAQADLHQLKLRRAQGTRVDDIEQKKAVERAKARIEEAEEKLVTVRRWGRIVQQAISEYQTHARRLADLVEGNPPRSVVAIDRVIASLESYLTAGPPVSSGIPPQRERAPIGNTSASSSKTP